MRHIPGSELSSVNLKSQRDARFTSPSLIHFHSQHGLKIIETQASILPYLWGLPEIEVTHKKPLYFPETEAEMMAHYIKPVESVESPVVRSKSFRRSTRCLGGREGRFSCCFVFFFCCCCGSGFEEGLTHGQEQEMLCSCATSAVCTIDDLTRIQKTPQKHDFIANKEFSRRI